MQNQGEESGEDKSWPGRDFELREYLPGSVYLWACGERDDEDQAPSASDAVVAWAVLLVSNLFERSEFLIATCKKKKTDRLDVCPDVRIISWF